MSIPYKKPINYLNNKDILKEIHASKNSYCFYEKPEYHRYDSIVDMPQDPVNTSLEYAYKPEIIQQAQENRAVRLGQELGTKVDPTTIPITDLVFRVMCWDHVPVAPKQPRKTVKKKTAKDIFELEIIETDSLFEDLEGVVTAREIDDMVHVKVNFPPFQHFKIDDTNSF